MEGMKFTARVDEETRQVAQRAATVIAVAVRVLRLPTAIVLWAPVPFIAATLVMALSGDDADRVVFLVAGALMALVSLGFGGRRRRILQAVEEPDKLATELAIMISLSDKVDETRGAITQIAGGGGWRLFERLRGLWKGAAMTGGWIDRIGDLPRARYFGPPKIGTTIWISVAALWLVPISVVVAFLALIGTVAGSV